MWRLRQLGLAYRSDFDAYLNFFPEAMTFLEFTAEHFFYGRSHTRLKQLAQQYPCVLHGVTLSIGSPQSVFAKTSRWRLEQIKQIIHLCHPLWFSEHFAFTRTSDYELGHLNPIPFTETMLDHFIDQGLQIRSLLKSNILFENITRYSELPGTMPEWEFINRFCLKSKCDLLLDLTNLYINAQNLQFDPFFWLSNLDLTYVKEIHVAGVSRHETIWVDAHRDPIDPQIRPLVDWVLKRKSDILIILERDENLTELNTLFGELNDLSNWTT